MKNEEGNNTPSNEGTLEQALDQAKADIDAQVKALEESKTKAEENWNLFLRARADMENVRKRAQLDIENARKYSTEPFAREIINVVDSLEQGLSIAESANDSAYRQGMALTLKLCLDIFEKFGITQIKVEEGGNFDPNRHEAISMQESRDYEANKILVIAQKGYMLYDRVLRPARVIVSKAPS